MMTPQFLVYVLLYHVNRALALDLQRSPWFFFDTEYLLSIAYNFHVLRRTSPVCLTNVKIKSSPSHGVIESR